MQIGVDKHPFYRLLSRREQDFIKEYKQTNDAIAASETVYPRNAASQLRRLLRKEHIASIISWIDGQEQPTRESLIQHALIIAHTAKSDQAKVDALKLAEKILNAQDERPSREKLIQKAKETDSHAKR